MKHTVRTTHIQKLIDNAAGLAELVDGKQAGELVVVGNTVHVVGHASVEQTLAKAAAELRHAADELQAELMSCYGWKQV